MKIIIIAVGKLKEDYLKKAIEDFKKTVNRKYPLEIIELPDEKTKENSSDKELALIKGIEGEKILKKIPKDAYVISLAIEGKEISSGALEKIVRRQISSHKDIVFIIGGSLGLANDVLKKSNYLLSFSKMTFPHQLMRVILLEQLTKVI